MKKIFLTLAVGALAISACKEKAPYIQLTPAPPKADTTYVLATVPSPEAHNVLIENFTGATCPNCPSAHDVIHALDSQYADRINVVSMHVTDFLQANPVHDAKYDFRLNTATQVEASVYGALLAMPVAGIDRLPVGQVLDGRPYQCFRASWNSIVADRIAVTDSINLALSSSFNAATRKATINIKITYLQDIKTLQNFTIAVVEDGLIDKQEFPWGIDTAYHFNDVFRGMVTSGVLGDAILPAMAVKEKGRVYEVTYTYDVSEEWNAANCKLVAYVHRDPSVGGSFVYQSKETHMIP